MIDQDYKKFGALMIMIGEMSDGNEAMKRPSIDKIKLYFKFLIDLPFETIEKNASDYFNIHKEFHGFPSPAILRHGYKSQDIEEAEALSAFEIIKELMENFYCPELGAAGRQAMIIKLEEKKQENLIPLLDKWGTEILTGNTQVVRAQFVKSYKAQKTISTDRQLRSNQPKQLKNILSLSDVL